MKKKNAVTSTAVKNILGYSTRKHKFKRMEPHSNFGDEVGMEGNLENCCRFVTHGSAPLGAHICLAK